MLIRAFCVSMFNSFRRRTDSPDEMTSRAANGFHSMTTHFHYLANHLYCDSVSLAQLAREFGTPLYVYSAATIREHYRRLAGTFAPLHPMICYAMKANFNLSLLRLLKDEGAGFDIVSGGELARALAVGVDPGHIVFAGVGKTEAELGAGLEAGIGWFNVESADEVQRLNALAVKRGQRAKVAVRLNPDVEPETHQHIRTGGATSKFGIPVEEALALAERWADFPALDLRGVHIHIGSQMATTEPLLRALGVALDFSARFPSITALDFGGGFPVAYTPADAYPSVEAMAAPIVEKLLPHVGRLSFHIEPGRYLVADSAVLLTEVQAVKAMPGQRVVVVDTGMHHLLRPMLYEAWHAIVPVWSRPSLEEPCLVAGPICESTDVLGRDRRLPVLQPGDLLAVQDVGAYGFAMASNYNAQPRPAEVMVEGGAVKLIRRRETWADLMRAERLD
jgi:diaminopimelate decarboxylase